MRDELQQLGVTSADIQRVLQAASMDEARARLDALKARARSRYEQLTMELHPDRTGGDKAKAERFKALSDVYRTLMEVQPLSQRQPHLATYYGETSSLSVTCAAVGG